MKRFYVHVTAISPLTIRADQAEGGVKTTQSIPGATFLGGLASAHRILRPEQQDEFQDFFLTERIRFPHLYPANFKHNRFDDPNLPVMPLPKTAQTCKRFSDFLPVPDEENTDEHHGIRDSLLDWGTFVLLNSEQQIAIPTLLAPFHDHQECSYDQGKYSKASCKQLMDHVSGYYRCDRSKAHIYAKANTNTRLQTRTGINREWGVVEESILYNREVFDEQARFWGEVILPDKLADAFKTFVEEANDENIIRIGTGRTRGLGSVKVELTAAPDTGATSINSKLDLFDNKMHERAKTAKIKQQYHAFYFAITLQSPTILCDPFLRYQKTIDPETLSRLAGLDPMKYTFELIYQSVRMQRITGWNELWGTPRPHDYALEMGSTFLYACNQKPDKVLKAALQALEDEGIGRRRSEGFGRISLSDPFHLESEQR